MYNKYKNKKVTTNGIIFDSVREYKRYKELKLLERANIIKELELQKKFILQSSYINAEGKRVREISYIADFYYYDIPKNKYIVEDTKGFRTEIYKLKKKMFEYKYNLTIKEV